MITKVNLHPTQSKKLKPLPGIGDLQYWLHCAFFATTKKFVVTNLNYTEDWNAIDGSINSFVRCTIAGVDYLNGSTIETAKVLALALDSTINGNYIEHRMEVIDLVKKLGKAETLIREFKELSEQDIAFMDLFYMKGWLFDEIALHLGLSVEAVEDCYLNMLYYFAHLYKGAIFLDIDPIHEN